MADRPAIGRFILAGAGGGLMSGLFGVGGGIVMVPLLIWLAKVDQRRAGATSLAAIVPTALAGAISYGWRGELVLWPAVAVAAGGVAGAWLGARILRIIKLTYLNWGFVGLISATAIWMVFYQPSRGQVTGINLPGWFGLVALGLAMGLAAGLFGIGGGVIAVPALMAIFGFSDLTARGTSLLVMVPSALAGTVTNWRGGLVGVGAASATGLAATAASLGGSALAFVVTPRLGNMMFAAVLAVSAIQLARRAARRPPRPGQTGR
jgi:uncharacterized membrane protein YfcA